MKIKVQKNIYPKIPRLLNRWEKKSILVQEKIDGSNFIVSFDKDKKDYDLRFFCKSKEITNEIKDKFWAESVKMYKEIFKNFIKLSIDSSVANKISIPNNANCFCCEILGMGQMIYNKNNKYKLNIFDFGIIDFEKLSIEPLLINLNEFIEPLKSIQSFNTVSFSFSYLYDSYPEILNDIEKNNKFNKELTEGIVIKDTLTKQQFKILFHDNKTHRFKKKHSLNTLNKNILESDDQNSSLKMKM